MPRSPSTRYGNASDDQYYGTWNTQSMPQYPGPHTAGSSSGSRPSQSQQYAMQSAPRQMPPPHQSSRAPTQVDSRPPDYWHNDKDMMCVNRGNAKEYPYSVSFRPTTGPCRFGVALLNLELGLRMVNGEGGLDQLLPPPISRFAHATLLVEWPGYRSESYILNLVDPRTRQHITRAQLGAQATQHFKNFINTRTEAHFFEDSDNALLLSVDGVSYEQVRLAELYTKDGMTFHMQFALNVNYSVV
ncbi:hypothetical protein FB45DRAFT_1065786 [Roridomyces roridus]|uniref:Uncharacterized protein n=1 Tax=Roridomyces roridus TaxID=1738132 RepID=A0AAD7B6R2_9AGAR|nr:hypothetical protein FB45DRAFT_1065786 [Roridomyces roridus]